MLPFVGGGSPGEHGRSACLRHTTIGEETKAHGKEEGEKEALVRGGPRGGGRRKKGRDRSQRNNRNEISIRTNDQVPPKFTM
jgi:hypothetical protein